MAERITGHTELIGLMAYPIRHSSSPAMHNEAFAYLGLDYAYLAFEVDNSTLEDAVKGIRALKMVGSNVSMPNKTDMVTMSGARAFMISMVERPLYSESMTEPRNISPAMA